MKCNADSMKYKDVKCNLFAMKQKWNEKDMKCITDAIKYKDVN